MSQCLGVDRNKLIEAGWLDQNKKLLIKKFTSSSEYQKFKEFIDKYAYFRERHGDSGCETDPSFQQLIGYGFWMDKQGKVLTYTRGGTHYNEKRLHGKISIGLGGHTDEADADIAAGLAREICEETIIWQGKRKLVVPPDSHPTDWLAAYCQLVPLGLIKDDRPDSAGNVGQVHLGVVFQIQPVSDDIHLTIQIGHESVKQELIVVEKLKQLAQSEPEQMETWTSLVAQHFMS